VKHRYEPCNQGVHSFSWRQGIEPCRYCGAWYAEPKNVDLSRWPFFVTLIVVAAVFAFAGLAGTCQ
jgi:hypothetical protein